MLGDRVLCAGTKTSETSMSWLPVARRPAVSQVSMIRQSDAWSQVVTISGPVGPSDIVSPLKTMLAGASALSTGEMALDGSAELARSLPRWIGVPSRAREREDRLNPLSIASLGDR
jgi:hypothetical protein